MLELYSLYFDSYSLINPLLNVTEIDKCNENALIGNFMILGLSLPEDSFENQFHYSKMAEEIGIDQVWLGDNPPDNNAFVSLAPLLSSTKNINFWTGVTSPFYYSPDVFKSIINWFVSNFSDRFGLGLSTGNYLELGDLDIQKHPVTNFKTRYKEILSYTESFKSNIAIGALGNAMCTFALQEASILSLNSGSIFDIKRVLDLHSTLRSRTNILPYAMMEIVSSEYDRYSSYLWFMTKVIAKSCSRDILKDHGYSPSEINVIHEFSWKFDSKPPYSALAFKLVRDFTIFGTVDQVIQKIVTLTKEIGIEHISGIILGWIYKQDQWDDIQIIRNELL